MNRYLSTCSAAAWQNSCHYKVRIGGKGMNMYILARRFSIITLFAAIFAITFSAVVVQNGGGGAQSHFGASYTCLETNGTFCGPSVR